MPEQRRTTMTGRAVVFVCVLAALAVTLAIPVREWLSQRAEIDRLEAEVGAARERVADLEGQVADWSDPAYISAQARARLHFVFPGDVGYVVLGDDERPLDAEAQPEPPAPGPWVDRAWDSLRAVDAAP